MAGEIFRIVLSKTLEENLKKVTKPQFERNRGEYINFNDYWQDKRANFLQNFFYDNNFYWPIPTKTKYSTINKYLGTNFRCSTWKFCEFQYYVLLVQEQNKSNSFEAHISYSDAQLRSSVKKCEQISKRIVHGTKDTPVC